MRKIIAALALVSITTPARADATETVEPKAAVEFVLSVCLPAMDDLANVERTARENNWFQLPTTAYASKATTPHLRWIADGYSVTIWSFKDRNIPDCFIEFHPYKKVNRNEFFEVFSASLQLEPGSFPPGQRLASFYKIVRERPLRLMLHALDDGTLFSVSVYMDAP